MNKCCLEIQRIARGYIGKRHFEEHKRVVLKWRIQKKAAIDIQRIYRGHKGKEARDIEIELMALEQRAKPLFDLLHTQETEKAALDRVSFQ
jgi:hypothetical protein